MSNDWRQRNTAITSHDDGLCPLCGGPRKSDRGKRYEFGDVVIEPGAVSKGGVTINVPPAIYAVLEAFAERAGKPTLRQSIERRVWGDREDPIGEKTVEQYVHKIRKGLGRAAIETRFGGIRIFRPERIVINPDVEWYSA